MNEKTTKPSKLKKILIITGSIILVLFLIFPFALDAYLKRKLPDLINDKTPYHLTLDQFDLDLFSGNLNAENLVINNKNKKDSTVTQINGTVKELKIEDFSIWKAVFDKTYKAKDVVLTDPNIAVVFAPKKDKTNQKKKKIDIALENIIVSNGNVKIQNHKGKILFNGQNVNIKLTNIKQSDDASKIPLAFEEFKIDAQNVVVTANEFYEINAKKISAKNKTLNILGFHLKPIQNAKNYNAKSIFDFSSDELSATNFLVDQDSLIVDQVDFVKPDLKITSTGKKTVEKKAEKEKEMNLKIGLKNINFNQGKILVLQSDLQKTASIDNFNFKLSNIVFDKNTVKEKIPFRFTNHNIEAENIYLKTDDLQALKIGKIKSENQDITIDNFELIPLGKSSHKDVLDIKTDKILITNNQSRYIGQQLNLNFAGIDVVNPKIKIYASKHPSKAKKKSSTMPDFKALVGRFNIKNGTFKQISEGKEKLSVGQFDINLNEIKSDKNIAKSDLPFTIKNHLITAKTINLDAGKHYRLKLASLKNSGKQTDLQNMEFLPKYSRTAFSKVIAVEEDLYTIKTKHITITDKDSKIGKNTVINLDKILIDNLNCNIYHDLAPPDDHAVRYLFAKKLRDVKFPLFVKQIQIRNSALTYEENAENANKPGKLTFEDFNATINNVNNTKIKGLPTMITVDSDFKFYGTAPTNVTWKFDVKDMEDKFTIVGNIQKLSADNVNLFVRPYLNVTLDGKIDYIKFDYYGSSAGIAGKFYFKYKDMYVNFINKNNGKERKILSTIANWFVKNESTGEPDHVKIEKKRDPEKSFFNMLWQGIMEGLKKYVI
ncbi:AsmA family protein [Epilithonimonas lactis]|uniref:DUF748 domain-containing protein n=1 Tax=Epilithonimonas lactis TaxID=421072 RepID=A0A085BG67_9FLAO|nr:hypothetical protein [Epilithonimonas lactis]KFC21462.1 hypothetical protein IO89_14895 [Epilithonimonas lactis]SEP86072.1 hypothetical protein SAMN04488097_0887 [Epilithonimonas lactis]